VLSGSDQPCNSVRVHRYLGFLLGGLAGEQGQRWTGHGRLLTHLNRPVSIGPMPAATPARDRLLDTASKLFYDQGITATGVDAVVAAAGVSKPTLYAHFRSKSELVAAVLDRRHTRRTESLQAWVAARTDDPRQRLLAVFDWLADFYTEEGTRGCAFLNAAAETPDPGDPARQVARRQKRWTQDFLAQLARDAGLDDPERLGSQLLLLIDGTSSRMVVEGDSEIALEIAEQARQVAAVVLDEAASRLTVPVA
jgi:AcrR family transcriptional regulator